MISILERNVKVIGENRTYLDEVFFIALDLGFRDYSWTHLTIITVLSVHCLVIKLDEM